MTVFQSQSFIYTGNSSVEEMLLLALNGFFIHPSIPYNPPISVMNQS